MARKFIISMDRFLMGNVELHMDLMPRKKESDPVSGLSLNVSGKDTHFQVLGGGRWHTDKEKKILYLWGESIDFGYAEPLAIKRAIESPETFVSPTMEGWIVMHSPVISNNMPDEDTFEKLTVIP